MESIISEFKRVLSEKKECPEGSISIYEVISRYREEERNFDNKKNEIINLMEKYYQTCNSCPGLFFNSMSVSAMFDYKENTMILDIYEINYKNKYKVYVTKQEEHLILKNSNSFQAENFYNIYTSLLSDLYDVYQEYESFHEDSIGTLLTGVPINNTELLFGLNRFKWTIRSFNFNEMVASSGKDRLNFIEIRTKKWTEQEKQYIRENIEDVFDSIYMEISKLPRYMQEDIRLEEEKKLQESQNVMEEKMSKKEERKVKFKSFINRFKKGD